MSTYSPVAPPRPVGERTLDAAHLAAMRVARAALHAAARGGDAAQIEAALAPFVHAMWTADFTRQTIRSLVAAAIDAGLPTGRGAVRRAQRADSLAAWVALADQLAEQLSQQAPIRAL